MGGVVRSVSVRAEHGEDARSRRQQEDSPPPRESVRFAARFAPALQGHEAGQDAHGPEKSGGKAEADVAVRPVERVADVAERPGHERQKKTETETGAAAHKDEEGRAEKHVAEEVLAVGVQGEGGHGPVPFAEGARAEDVERPFLDPCLGVEAGHAREIG